jgi:hypothetical protein
MVSVEREVVSIDIMFVVCVREWAADCVAKRRT